MLYARISILPIFFLAGCAGPGTGFSLSPLPWPFTPDSAEVISANSGRSGFGGHRAFNFDWQLSGDPEIMPIQVFDDGSSMWLQFAPEGAWPAVFEVVDGGWRPLSYRREPPYMLLDGLHHHLELRGGHLSGTVKRMSTPLNREAHAVGVPADIKPPQGVPAMQDKELAEAEVGMAVPGTSAVLAEPRPSIPAQVVDQTSSPALALPAYLGVPVPRYSVSPADHTIRQALERWARDSGWTFSAEHWAVDVDIPLVGVAAFDTEFKAAVRELLAATEMGDRPLQPCFYSNQVLRVVPYAQACDRSAGTRAVS